MKIIFLENLHAINHRLTVDGNGGVGAKRDVRADVCEEDKSVVVRGVRSEVYRTVKLELCRRPKGKAGLHGDLRV